MTPPLPRWERTEVRVIQRSVCQNFLELALRSGLPPGNPGAVRGAATALRQTHLSSEAERPT